MKIIDSTGNIADLYTDGSFDMEKWKAYMSALSPEACAESLRDMERTLAAGPYTYEKDYLPVLNAALADTDRRIRATESFHTVTDGLEQRISAVMGRCPEVDIILYLGLCCGAGWVDTFGGRKTILLGIEKIIELDWCGIDSMYGLIYHELGHVYQAQFGVLERPGLSRRDSFLWQLFTEGVAMYFEQLLVGDMEYFHQDRDGWKDWCDANISRIKSDFNHDLPEMEFATQRWFGDWVSYEGLGDVGYYLGARLVQHVCKDRPFDSIISLNIAEVTELYEKFITSESV